LKYKLKQNLSSPKGYDSLSLFEFCVNKLIQKINDVRYPLDLNNSKDAFKNHIQWTSLIFGLGNDTNKNHLSKVKSDFSSYFINYGTKYKWNFERIYDEHPQFFVTNKSNRDTNIYSEMFEALEHEILESKRDTKKNNIRVQHIGKIKLANGVKIYEAKLEIDEDDDPKLVEDLPITVLVGGLKFETKVLDFDKFEGKLYFQHEEDFTKYYGNVSIQSDASWILEKIKVRIKESQINNSLGSLILKFLNSKVIPEPIFKNKEEINNNISTLDESQFDAYKYALLNDISIIWGPPGTGKSHTLASIINTLFIKKEKTLITCIANVAVDAITLKLIDLINKQNLTVEQGEILRIGYTRDKKLLETEYLFPDNPITKKFRDRIIQIDNLILNSRKGLELELKKERQDLMEKLKKEINSLIENSIITFATASKFFVDGILNDREYDNLIIDEASMVSIPHFIALGLKIKKRIIITGDFRQLGPVVLSQSEMSKKWLHRDIFEFSGINPKEVVIKHPALKQLLIQRRSHELICNLINKPFYQGKLKSETKFENDQIVHIEPFIEKILVYKNVKKNNKVEFTKKGSRFNKNSAQTILGILNQYSKENSLVSSIGIVTPYRGQVKLIKDLIAQRNYSKSFNELVKVGTIHAFQGSECDLIIFDTVDSIEENIGRLYRFEMGKRLVNVALSRAKYKLIICGDLDVFLSGKGYNNIDLSLTNIFNTLKHYQVNE